MCSNERLTNIELSSDNDIRCDITCTSTYRLKITYANTFHFMVYQHQLTNQVLEHVTKSSPFQRNRIC